MLIRSKGLYTIVSLSYTFPGLDWLLYTYHTTCIDTTKVTSYRAHVYLEGKENMLNAIIYANPTCMNDGAAHKLLPRAVVVLSVESPLK